MATGWIKVYRSIWDKGWSKRPEFIAVWLYLLKEATHERREDFWNGKSVFIEEGQFITGRSKIAENTGVHESSVERILKTFEIEQQIEQRKTSTSRLISILNWNKYQEPEQRFEQPLNNERTTAEQRLNTKQEYKELKKRETAKKIEPVTPLQKFIAENLPNVSKITNQLTEKESERLIAKYPKQLISDVLKAMENRKNLAKDYTSVNLTIQSWIKFRLKNSQKNDSDPQPPKADYSKQNDYYAVQQSVGQAAATGD